MKCVHFTCHACPDPTPKVSGIQLWDWDEAPEHYKKLSDNGGDEDGVIFIPKGTSEPYWLENVYRYDDSPQRIELPEGLVIIWAHA